MTERPDSPKVPKEACDCHAHVLDPRFGRDGDRQSDHRLGTVREFGRHLTRIGVSRAILVQAKYHGTDPACLLDAIAELGQDRARGIAVVQPSVTDRDLQHLHRSGVRGLRFSIWKSSDAVVATETLLPLAERVAALGWHVQVHATGDQIIANKSLLEQLPCPLVIDHMGRLLPDLGPHDPAFGLIQRLIDRGSTWVKISGPYLNSKLGPPYPEAATIAKALISFAPERLVWGSDWPHVTEPSAPDDVDLFDLFRGWAGSSEVVEQILVRNPQELYFT